MAKGRSGFKLGGWPDTGRLISTLMPLTTPSIRAEGGDPMTAFERLVDATGARRVGSGWMALCPAHEDRNPSLSVSEGDTCALVTCHAGCETEAVLSALGISMRDLYDEPLERTDPDEWVPKGHEFVDSYDYVDASGRLVFQVVRARDEKGEKTFWQRRPDSGSRSGWAWNLRELSEEQRLIPYRLPAVLSAVESGEPIWVVEGEKDVEAMRRAGVTATCNAGGASNTAKRSKWTARHADYLRGAAVTVVQDKDAPGRAHGAAVAASLSGVAASVRLVEAKSGKDAHDHLAAGLGLGDFVEVEPVEVAEAKEEGKPSDAQMRTDEGTSVEDDLTDAGLALRVAAEHGHRLRYVGEWKRWLTWDGRRWQHDVTGAVSRAVVNVGRTLQREAAGEPDKNRRFALHRAGEHCRSARGVRDVTTLLATVTGVVIRFADLDADPDLLNVENGTLDLRTGSLRPHDPGDHLTKVAGAAYEPGEPGLFSTFLERVQPDPGMRDFLGRLLGHALEGRVTEHLLPIFYGEGANGKSVLGSVVMGALGDYAITAEPGLLLERGEVHATGLADLAGRRLAITHEVDAGRHLAEATVKRLTGGDRIKARRMREDWWEFDPSHAVLMLTNHRPLVAGDDAAIWRRLRVVPWDVIVPGEEQDPRLSERLREEALAEVLRWLVAGHRAWQERGLAEPEQVQTATAAYRTESDHLARFMDERCMVGQQYSVGASDLFVAWQHWSQTQGVEAGSQTAFGKSLAKRGIESRTVSGGRKQRVGLGLLAVGGASHE